MAEEPRDGELETALEMSSALRSGEVTAELLCRRALRRAEAWQPATNAFSQLWAEEALAAAAAAERGRGIPIAVKDLFDVAGHETTSCSRAFAGNVATADAPVVGRVRRAGVVMIGKTNQHELAAGGTNLVSACGRTGNPWDPARMTGGSSGGSAAAVAAGVVPWALGSDTGGSIRIPAAMCGTFGLKPTTGRLPIEGLLPLAPSMDCPGPLAATSGDLGLLWMAMAKERSAYAPEPRPRVGIARGFFTDVVDPEIEAAVESVAATLEGAGVPVEDVDGSGIEDARRVWMTICTFEFSRAYEDVRDRRSLIGPSVLEWLEQGDRVTEQEYERAQALREEIRRWFVARLPHPQATLLLSTTPYPAPRAEAESVDLGRKGSVSIQKVGPGRLTSAVNLAGLPALNLPAARSGEGLPIGVTLVAGPDQEGILLHLAERWESAAGYRPAHPPLPVSAI